MFTKITLSFILLQTVFAERNIRLSCENEIVQLDCPKGSTISVLSATYGKKDSKYCNQPKISTSNCEAGNSLNIVKFRCNRKQICKVPASNDVFGDPCYGTRKYLEVTYECLTGDIESKIACENDVLKITCPDEHIIWTANALYGRKNPLTCIKENAGIKTNNCASSTALDVIQTRCDNLQECTVVANNAGFGDPCAGTYKYLEVDYHCLHSESEIIRLSHVRIH